MTYVHQTRQAWEARIIAEAGQNPAFRRRLLDDPKAALADFLDISLPPGITITLLEEQPGQHYLVLPPAPPDLDALPLDELELALVGGGRTLQPIPISCTDTRIVRHNSGATSRSSC